MNRDIYNRRTIIRYTLLQVPDVALFAAVLYMLHRFVHPPVWMLVLALAVWIAKDVILYPLLARAYAGGKSVMTAGRGVAYNRIDPRGRVRVRGELWQAQLEPGETAIAPGEDIVITGRHGLVLTVRKSPLKPGS